MCKPVNCAQPRCAPGDIFESRDHRSHADHIPCSCLQRESCGSGSSTIRRLRRHTRRDRRRIRITTGPMAGRVWPPTPVATYIATTQGSTEAAARIPACIREGKCCAVTPRFASALPRTPAVRRTARVFCLAGAEATVDGVGETPAVSIVLRRLCADGALGMPGSGLANPTPTHAPAVTHRCCPQIRPMCSPRLSLRFHPMDEIGKASFIDCRSHDARDAR